MPTPRPTPTPVPTPAAAALLAPQGTVAAPRSGYLWNHEPTAVQYRLTIETALGALVHQAVYPAAGICTRGRCVALPSVSLPLGDYRWSATALLADTTELAAAPLAFTLTNTPHRRLIHHSQTTGHMRAWFMNGLVKVGEAPLFGSAEWDSNVVGTGDFNRDGRHDLLLRETDGDREVETWELNGLDATAAVAFPPVGGQAEIRGVADFNRDGTLDLVIDRGSQGVLIQYMNGPIVLSTQTVGGPGPKWRIVGVGDVDRDLWPDIVWKNGFEEVVKVWYMQNQVQTAEATIPVTDVREWHWRAVADVDLDGDVDILCWRPSDKTTAAWLLEAASDRSVTATRQSLGSDTGSDLGWRPVGWLPYDVPYTSPVTVNGSAHPITVAPGAAVTVAVTGGPGLPRDWVAKQTTTAPLNTYMDDWKYLDGTQTPPATGQTNATLTFTMPRSMGDYQFRFFRDNVFDLLATSPTVKVRSNAVVSVNWSLNPITVNPGAMVYVTVGNGPAFPTDWVGRVAYGAESNTHGSAWQYLDGTQEPPSSGVSSATLHFVMPSTAGDYEFRFFENNAYTVLARSPKVRVASLATMTVNGSSTGLTLPPGSLVTVSVAGSPGYPLDWVAKHQATATDKVHFADWKYLDGSQEPPAAGQTSASLAFAIPRDAGQYNFRLFHNNTSVLLATSPTVTVEPPVVTVNGSTAPLTVAPGATVTVAVSNGPAYPADWVAKHDLAALDNVHYPDWKYLDGTQTPPATGAGAATLSFVMPTAPGEYNFRMHKNDTAAVLATSATVTVAP